MSIPKVIYQTYATNNLPLTARAFILWMKFINPSYKYEFYDDARIEKFLKAEFDEDVFKAYKRIDIGAAKGDFFQVRYVVQKRRSIRRY